MLSLDWGLEEEEEEPGMFSFSSSFNRVCGSSEASSVMASMLLGWSFRTARKSVTDELQCIHGVEGTSYL